MKRIVTTIALALLFMGASAQQLTIRVSGIRSNIGKIVVGIGDYKLNPKGMTGKMVDADSTGVQFVFDSLPVGENHIYVAHIEQDGFRPELLAQMMMLAMSQDNSQRGVNGDKLPKVGFGVDHSGGWEPLASGDRQIVDFEIKYINFKK